MSLPQIETIQTLPSYHATHNQLHPILSVGVQLNNGQLYWGDCRLSDGSTNHHHTQAIIDQLVVPQLIGQEVGDFFGLCQIIDETMEPYQYEEIIPEAERPQVADKNRRKFWQQLSQQEVIEPTRVVQAERPLSPALRFGLSQAVLQACATNKSIPAPPPLNTNKDSQLIVQAEDVSHTPLFPHVGGVRYKIQTGDPKTHLGQQGEKLQGYLRQLGQWMSRMATAGNYDHQPVIYLEANTITGALYDNNLGRLLGMIYGLEHATKPYQLYLIDPLSHDDPEKLLEETKKLINYLRFRKLETKIGVSRPLNSTADIDNWLNQQGADHLCLHPHQLGSLGNLWRTAEKCHTAGVSFTVACHPQETDHTLQQLTTVSRSIQPTFFQIPSGTNRFLQVNRWQVQNTL